MSMDILPITKMRALVFVFLCFQDSHVRNRDSRSVTAQYSRIVQMEDSSSGDFDSRLDKKRDDDGADHRQTAANDDDSDSDGSIDGDLPIRERIVKREWHSFIAMQLIVFLIAWSWYAYTFQYFALAVRTPGKEVSAVFNLIVYYAIFGMMCWSYYRAVTCSPSFVPENWVSPDCVERKRNGTLRTCKYCQCVKPDRSHHCSSCDACVLKMDHHCVWINNCAGFGNYKYFVLFISYASLTGYYGSISAFMSGGVSMAMAKSVSSSFFLLFNILIQSMFGLVLMCFAGFHFFLIFQNSTTLEFLEKRSHRRAQFGNGNVNPFNVGKARNFTQVFGSKKLYWLLPVRKFVPGDGFTFPISEDVRLRFMEGGSGQHSVPVTEDSSILL
eukprot:ANDGO_08564.mRNA.1 putative protein S-acyltransferase 12